jgi:hypothetical protein
MLERDPEFHSEIITGDEMRIDEYDAETKLQFKWKSPSCPCPRKAEQVCSKVKSKLTGFLTFTGMFVTNLFRKDKLETSIVTLTSYSICGTMCGEYQVKNGTELIGLFMRTVHLLLFCLRMNLWLKHLVPRDLLFPKLKMLLK